MLTFNMRAQVMVYKVGNRLLYYCKGPTLILHVMFYVWKSGEVATKHVVGNDVIYVGAPLES